MPDMESYIMSWGVAPVSLAMRYAPLDNPSMMIFLASYIDVSTGNPSPTANDTRELSALTFNVDVP